MWLGGTEAQIGPPRASVMRTVAMRPGAGAQTGGYDLRRHPVQAQLGAAKHLDRAAIAGCGHNAGHKQTASAGACSGSRTSG
jgi:hypothetical protein